MFKGSNLSGGDTAYTDWSSTGPVSGTHYLFVSNQDIDYLIGKGFNHFRLLFAWEAVQPQANGAVPVPTGNHRTYYDTFKSRVDYITAKGASVIIDIHPGFDADFAAYRGAKIGTTYGGLQVTELFCNLWGQLAAIFKSNPLVFFGMTNEPSNMPTMTWFACAQKAINAIRATGSTNKIVMPGNAFTGASSWTTVGAYSDTGNPLRSNGYGWLNANGPGLRLTDPANNLAMQVHLYADSSAGGGATDVVSGTILADRVKVAVDWARANGVQVFVAEVGLSAAAPNAINAWNSFITYLNANSDVVLGYTFWSYGPPAWWGNYQFTLCPSSNYTVDSNQMKMIGVAVTPPVPGPVPSPVSFSKGVSFKLNNYWIFVPTTYDSSHNTPIKLFAWLHGCGGQSQYDVSMVSPGGTQNWIAIAPDGREGACWSDVSVDGAAIMAAIADVKTHFRIDPAQVYLGGYSSGGDIGYPLLFQNPGIFAGGLFENTAPNAQALTLSASVSKKMPITHLAHLSDGTYPIAAARANAATLRTNGFPVTLIEKAGTHYDADGGAYGTSYDLRTFLLPYLNPVIPVDPTIAALQAQVADLTAKLNAANVLNTALVSTNSNLTTANSNLSTILAKIKALVP
jgi:endoglucanase